MSSTTGSSPTWQRKPGNRVFRVPRVEPWRILIPAAPEKKTGGPSFWTIIAGFAGIIGVGTLLLILPFSSESRQLTSPITALFTATSSVCVTGLIVVDTANYWNSFGEVVILLMIQLGGFGFMAITTLFLISLGRRLGLREKLLVGESVGLSWVGEVRKLVRNLMIFTLVAELIGASIFYSQFSLEFGTGEAIWKSVFHSISAFNNAGFDIFGGSHSLTNYSSSPLLLLTTAGLIIIGGLSFLVIQDVLKIRRIQKFSIDTKMVLSVTGVLLGLGMLIALATEFANPNTLGSMTFPDKLLNSFFHSVTSRTAGFNTFSIGDMTAYALFFTMIMMFIGGASGSTAGGIKVGTFGLILMTMWSAIRGREFPGSFNREFMTSQIFRALAVVMLSIGLVCVIVFFLTITEEFDFLQLAFEAVSAFGTTGLSTGITPDLSITGKILIILSMFIGRLGPLTLTLTLVKAQSVSVFRYPKEIIRVG
jgi:trk system potassium uptake protein TrkH